MKNVYMYKSGNNLCPANQDSADRLQKIKPGKLLLVDIVQPRNNDRLRRFFVLLNFGYDYFEPVGDEYKGVKPAKNFNRFRSDVLILAGHYDVVSSIGGKTRLIAKSINFASTDEEEFVEIYKSVFDVIWNKVLSKTMSELDMNNAISRLMSLE